MTAFTISGPFWQWLVMFAIGGATYAVTNTLLDELLTRKKHDPAAQAPEASAAGSQRKES